MNTIAWLGLDAHARSWTLAELDESGQEVGLWEFETSPEALVKQIQAVRADQKHLAVEEAGMGHWISQLLKPHLTQMVVCCPRHNRYISRNPKKSDREDARRLARLLRLGELHAIWQAEDPARADLRMLGHNYEQSVWRQTALKQQIKSIYRSMGIMALDLTVYGVQRRQQWLARIHSAAVQQALKNLYALLDAALKHQHQARRLLIQQGKQFPEIQRLQTVPGVGPIGAHLFVAIIQDPNRFATQQKLLRYCRLGIRDRSSDGKPLGYLKLDNQGYGTLKAISYRAWLSAVKRQRGPLWQFYQSSLQRTHNSIHARLNCQRKLLETMWVLWRSGKCFEAEKFLGTAPQHA